MDKHVVPRAIYCLRPAAGRPAAWPCMARRARCSDKTPGLCFLSYWFCFGIRAISWWHNGKQKQLAFVCLLDHFLPSLLCLLHMTCWNKSLHCPRCSHGQCGPSPCSLGMLAMQAGIVSGKKSRFGEAGTGERARAETCKDHPVTGEERKWERGGMDASPLLSPFLSSISSFPTGSFHSATLQSIRVRAFNSLTAWFKLVKTT